MRVGIVILPEHRWSEAAPRWREADAMGFDHAWTYDHLVWGGLVGSPWFGAYPTLTAAAGVTERIRLGTFVTSPNYRHPYLLLRDLLTLDDVSGGRAIVGLGTGGDLDSAILGESLSLRERVDRFHEFVPLLDRLLREDHVDHEGRWFATVDARTAPGSLQRPRVPFAVAANGPRSMRLAATFGDLWVTSPRAPEGTLDAWLALAADHLRRFDEALATVGAARSVDAPAQRCLALDAAPVFALGSADLFEELVGRAESLGFTDVIAPWPRAEGPFAGDEAVVGEVASRLLDRSGNLSA